MSRCVASTFGLANEEAILLATSDLDHCLGKLFTFLVAMTKGDPLSNLYLPFFAPRPQHAPPQRHNLFLLSLPAKLLFCVF